MSAQQNSYAFVLTREQQQILADILTTGNYRPATVEHTIIAASGNDCRINLYKSGKCLVQGKGATDFVTFVLEPLVLKEVRTGYDEILAPDALRPHMGVDESGKGDFFGPLVTVAAYVDGDSVAQLKEIGLRESKRISSDKTALSHARDIRKILRDRYSIVTIGPTAYNRLYAKMRNVNRMLAWAHARAIENLLDKVPSCPRALSDQFGNREQVERALMKKGKDIKLEQRHRAESDPAVAAASVLARASFLTALSKIGQQHDMEIPKGASDAVQTAAVELVKKTDPGILLETGKCHFKTTDAVLAKLKLDRSVLGPEGQVQSKPSERFRRK